MTVSGTPASTSCRASPSPQSITYAALFVTITCADAELTLRGRGPPPVPRRMSLVRLCTLTDRERATAPAIVVARNPRRLMVAKSQRFYRHLRHSTNGRRWGAGLFGIRTASKCFNTLRAHSTRSALDSHALAIFGGVRNARNRRWNETLCSSVGYGWEAGSLKVGHSSRSPCEPPPAKIERG